MFIKKIQNFSFVLGSQKLKTGAEFVEQYPYRVALSDRALGRVGYGRRPTPQVFHVLFLLWLYHVFFSSRSMSLMKAWSSDNSTATPHFLSVIHHWLHLCTLVIFLILWY